MQKAQLEMLSGKLRPSDEYVDKLAGIFEEDNSDRTFEFDRAKPFAHPHFWSPFVLIGNWR